MRALPEEQRQQSMLAILDPYRHPQRAGAKSSLPTGRFQAASQAAGFEVPRLSKAVINKYLADLTHLQML